jgi:hypothetical protein
MSEHRLEVADVFHAHQHEFLQRWGPALSDQQRKVLRDIGLCRTAALGTLRVVVRCSPVEPPSPSFAIHCATFDTS